MNPFDFEQLRDGKAECPSDVTLWRLHAGELKGDDLATAQKHVAGCEDCAARMAQRQAGFDAYPEADPRRMFAAIRAKSAEPQGFWAKWGRTLRMALAPLAVGAAALALFARQHPETQIEDDTSRPKGGAILHVFREVDGVGKEVVNGEQFKPGDKLRFSVDLKTDHRIQIVGIEGSGRLYQALPQGESTLLLSAGNDQAVPGAVELDESAGNETLYLVACEPTEATPSCVSKGAKEPPACKPGCETKPFVLTKGP